MHLLLIFNIHLDTCARHELSPLNSLRIPIFWSCHACDLCAFKNQPICSRSSPFIQLIRKSKSQLIIYWISVAHSFQYVYHSISPLYQKHNLRSICIVSLNCLKNMKQSWSESSFPDWACLFKNWHPLFCSFMKYCSYFMYINRAYI